MLSYRILLSLAAPGLALLLLRDRPFARERLGLSGPERPRHPVIWLHGASNGELASARPLIERLLARRPDLCIVATSNSRTGRALVESWALR
ncbi:3-deoxy-D-manno-octulosonic acid transferase, partial [Rhodovulum sulfidophilum]|uniref:glycosyltransferase N-terminal domain-containing protein n=1 Tax=Rhodovulum sulfidophilum TaxID=35806 RepID=UPI001A5CD2A6|nr:3-deoxy-D-manno-octulosonic acid transferase [Rhodovulum sulfidophilum]